MVSAMMLAAPGSSVTGMKGREEEAPEGEGVMAEDGVRASSEEACSEREGGLCHNNNNTR